MEKYEINTKTMALIPVSNSITQVIEEEKELFINMKTFEIVDHSCKYFGSSYEGRHKGTIDILGFSYKTPILVEETQNIVFFPTISARDSSCYWISLNKIDKYVDNNGFATIIFKNGYELDLEISTGSLQNQIFRSTMLESVIRKRRKIS